MQMGDYVNVISIYTKADSVAQIYFEEDPYQSATAALNLGIIHTSHRYYTEGEEHLKRALPFFQQYDDQYREEYVELLLQLGSCLQNKGRGKKPLNSLIEGSNYHV